MGSSHPTATLRAEGARGCGTPRPKETWWGSQFCSPSGSTRGLLTDLHLSLDILSLASLGNLALSYSSAHKWCRVGGRGSSMSRSDPPSHPAPSTVQPLLQLQKGPGAFPLTLNGFRDTYLTGRLGWDSSPSPASSQWCLLHVRA